MPRTHLLDFMLSKNLSLFAHHCQFTTVMVMDSNDESDRLLLAY